MVTIYDASGLMPLQLELAERYVLVNFLCIQENNVLVFSTGGYPFPQV